STTSNLRLETLNQPIRIEGSEIQLSAQLEDSRIQNGEGRQPAWAVHRVEARYRARIQRVVRIEVRLKAHMTRQGEDLGHPQIEPANAPLELRLRHHERHVGRQRASRQAPAE